LGNGEVTPKAAWLVAKLLTKRDAPKAPYAIDGPLGPVFYSIDETIAVAHCLENQVTEHDLCD
jgi:hypothetical protein